jgi:hypothetical protein
MKKGILALAGIFSVCLLVLGLWGFINNQMKISDSFSGHTRINGVDCSGLTVEETAAVLTDEWNKREFIIKSNGELIKSLRGLNFEYNISKSLQSVLVHSGMHPLLTWIAKGVGNPHIPMTIAKVNPGFTSQINMIRFVSQHDYKATKNAYVDMSTTTFPIIKEVYGNTTDKKKLLKNVLANIEQGTFLLDATKSDYYLKPTILSDDPSLIATQQSYLNNFAFKITYDFGYNSQVLTPKVISGMLQREGNSLVVRTDQVKSFIKTLAYRFDHAGMSRYFYDSTGTKVSVYGSDYGYLINQSAEVVWLTNALKSGKSARRTPEYLPTARSHSNSALGTSYVEINLTSQHLWIYRNGNLVLATPVVTGNVAKGTATPPGSYSIYFMQLNRILKGKDWDGTMYATPVHYWMAFNGGVGLHDAPWRYSFGGTIYKRNGSHGCVNMPPKMAAAAYSLLSVGYKVVVHY